MSGIAESGSYVPDLLPVTRLKTIQLLDILEQQWKHMDTGLRRALRLNEQEGLLKAVIEKVFCACVNLTPVALNGRHLALDHRDTVSNEQQTHAIPRYLRNRHPHLIACGLD